MKKTLYWIAILQIIFLGYLWGFKSNTRPQVEVSKVSEVTPLQPCTRTAPYEMTDRLEKNLDIVLQTPQEKSLKNCLHVKWNIFPTPNIAGSIMTGWSTRNDIPLNVDVNYQDYDDIFLQLVLVHEVRHAVNAYFGNQNLSCVENEVDSFYAEIVYLTNYDSVAWNKIVESFPKNISGVHPYYSESALLNITKNAFDRCGKDMRCVDLIIKGDLAKHVSSLNSYREQCQL